MPEVAKLSHTHHAILEFMVANPSLKNREVAAKFGYTEAWLSCIIHSDAFQRQLKERQDQTFNHTVLPLRDKMNIIAHKMLDKVIEAPVESIDLDTAKETGLAMLDRLGFSPKHPSQLQAPPGNGIPGVTAGAALLEQARGLIGVKSKMTVTTTLEVSSDEAVSNPAQAGGDRMGSVQGQRALPAIEGEYSVTKEGAGV